MKPSLRKGEPSNYEDCTSENFSALGVADGFFSCILSLRWLGSRLKEGIRPPLVRPRRLQGRPTPRQHSSREQRKWRADRLLLKIKLLLRKLLRNSEATLANYHGLRFRAELPDFKHIAGAALLTRARRFETPSSNSLRFIEIHPRFLAVWIQIPSTGISRGCGHAVCVDSSKLLLPAQAFSVRR